jgi:methylated-DNA-protein-cysteine methyltransferase-like protein
VATYGQIAEYAGFRGAARQVAFILHSSSQKEDLPWHRIINASGTISLKRGHGHELQKKLLKDEGVVFDPADRIDLVRFRWSGEP